MTNYKEIDILKYEILISINKKCIELIKKN